jgi:hypothetical protein
MISCQEEKNFAEENGVDRGDRIDHVHNSISLGNDVRTEKRNVEGQTLCPAYPLTLRFANVHVPPKNARSLIQLKKLKFAERWV